jgi:hypothetical protein
LSDSGKQGFDLRRFIQRRSVEVLSSALVLFTAFLFWDRMTLATGGQGTPPLDDTYIYLQYAKNFAMGDFYAWLPDGGYTTGATSMLYVPILAIFERVGFEGHALFGVAFTLGLVLWALSLVLLGRQLKEVFGHGPALIGLTAAGTCGIALWNVYSGMDSALLLFMTLWAFQECTKTQAAKPGSAKVWVLLLMLSLTRPEGVVFALVLGLWLSQVHKGQSWQRRWGPTIVVLVTMLLVMCLHWYSTGTVRTNGMATKSWLTDPTLTRLESLDRVLGEMGAFIRGVLWPTGAGWHRALLLCLFFPAAAWCVLRKRHLWVLSLLVLVGVGLSFQSSYANVHRNRYQSAFLPIALAMGVAWLMSYAWTLRESLKRSLVGAFILFLLWSGHKDVEAWSWRYALDARDIQRHPVAMGDWIREKIPRDAVVAVHDAGAMPYFSGHTRFLDLVGLGTNGMGAWYRSGPGTLFEKIESMQPDKRPDYYIIYPDWFENADLHQRHPIFSILLKRWSIVPHPEKMVFEARKDLFGSGEKLWSTEFQSFRILAAADLANLDSETTYSFSDGGRPGLTSYLRGRGADGRPAGDGARWIQKTSTLTFLDYEGIPNAMVFRVAAPKGGLLKIRVADEEPIDLSLPPQSGFLEYKIDVLATPTLYEIEVSMDPGDTYHCQIGHVFLVSTIQEVAPDP